MDEFKRMVKKLYEESGELYLHLQHSRPEQLNVAYIRKKIEAIRLLSVLAEQRTVRREESWRRGIERLKHAQHVKNL